MLKTEVTGGRKVAVLPCAIACVAVHTHFLAIRSVLICGVSVTVVQE